MPPLVPFTQPEQALENDLVAQLVGLGFAKAAVTDEATMLANLKAELGAFNGLQLSALLWSC
jgi:type I restriction enzyme R subunit